MPDLSDALLLAFATILGVLMYAWRREIEEAIEAFNNNLPRGGPPTAMHPSPAGDDSLLRPNSRTTGKQK